MSNCNRGCNPNYDVRCCCELNCRRKNSNIQFQNCPMRISTIYFHITNDYDMYTEIEDDLWHTVKKKYKLTNIEIDELRDRFLEEHPVV